MKPESQINRSPVYRQSQALGAEFVEVNGYAVPSRIGEPSAGAAAVRRLSLCDLSGLARIGVKGPGTAPWVAAQGFDVPDESNRAVRQKDGAVIARLAPGEVFVLGDLGQQGTAVADLDAAWRGAGDPAAAPRGYIVPRQHSHAWFRMTGEKAAETLAKVCGVDLRPAAFHDLQIAQTSVARLSAVAIRDDLAGVHAFHLLADSASAAYFWDCLMDAGQENDIHAVGWDTLRDFLQ